MAVEGGCVPGNVQGRVSEPVLSCFETQGAIYSGEAACDGDSMGTTTAAGFEPARADPSGFLVHRLNHSAKPPASLSRTSFLPVRG